MVPHQSPPSETHRSVERGPKAPVVPPRRRRTRCLGTCSPARVADQSWAGETETEGTTQEPGSSFVATGRGVSGCCSAVRWLHAFESAVSRKRGILLKVGVFLQKGVLLFAVCLFNCSIYIVVKCCKSRRLYIWDCTVLQATGVHLVTDFHQLDVRDLHRIGDPTARGPAPTATVPVPRFPSGASKEPS